MINARVENWQAISWLIERQFPTRFSKPEIQISLTISFNQTVNALSITITAGEAKQIEQVAEPVRQSVKAMFAKYKPAQLGNGGRDRESAISESTGTVCQLSRQRSLGSRPVTK